MTDEMVTVAVIMSIAGFIRGAFGFGDALVAMPLLVLVMPLPSASPLMAMVALLIAFVILCREWQAFELRSASVLIFFGMIGIPLGVMALDVVDERIVKTILGIVIVTYAAWSWRRPEGFQVRSGRTAPLFGFLAGILGGAYNTSGPPLVIYASLQRWPAAKFRAMTQAYCLFSSTCILTAHALRGNITSETFCLLGCAAPFAITATIVAQRLSRRIDQQLFLRWVLGLLLLLGLNLIVSSW